MSVHCHAGCCPQPVRLFVLLGQCQTPQAMLETLELPSLTCLIHERLAAKGCVVSRFSIIGTEQPHQQSNG